MAQPITPLTFLNPLEMMRAAGRGAGVVVDSAASTAGKAIGYATTPAANAATAVGEDLRQSSRDLKDTITDVATKAIVAEAIWVGGAILGGLLLVYFLQKSPEAKAGARLLATKALTRGG